MKAILLTLALIGADKAPQQNLDGPVPEAQWRTLSKDETETLMLGTAHRTPELKKWWHEIDGHVCVARVSLSLSPDNRYLAKSSSTSKFSTSVEWGQVPAQFKTIADVQAKRQKASGARNSRDLGTHALVFRPDVIQHREIPSDDYVLPEQFKEYSIIMPDPVTLKGDGRDLWTLTQRSIGGGDRAKIVSKPDPKLVGQIMADARAKGKIKHIPQYHFAGLKDVWLYIPKKEKPNEIPDIPNPPNQNAAQKPNEKKANAVPVSAAKPDAIRLVEVAPISDRQSPKMSEVPIPKNATKVEVTFFSQQNPNVTLDAGEEASMTLNGKYVVKYQKTYTGPKNERFRVFLNAVTGDEINTRKLTDEWIDVTPRIQQGEANVFKFSHADTTPRGFRVRITADGN